MKPKTPMSFYLLERFSLNYWKAHNFSYEV